MRFSVHHLLHDGVLLEERWVLNAINLSGKLYTVYKYTTYLRIVTQDSDHMLIILIHKYNKKKKTTALLLAWPDSVIVSCTLAINQGTLIPFD